MGGSMGGMGGGGGGGMGGMMGGEKKDYTGANKGHGFVCGQSAGAEYGKWIGLVAGTVAGSMFGVPMLGMAGAQVGKSMGSQIDPSTCTPKSDPGLGKRPPMPPGMEDQGSGADATGAATENSSQTKTTEVPPMQLSAGSSFSEQGPDFQSRPARFSDYDQAYDPYAEMAKHMTFGGSNW